VTMGGSATTVTKNAMSMMINRAVTSVNVGLQSLTQQPATPCLIQTTMALDLTITSRGKYLEEMNRQAAVAGNNLAN